MLATQSGYGGDGGWSQGEKTVLRCHSTALMRHDGLALAFIVLTA
jgi:hypothetical protein